MRWPLASAWAIAVTSATALAGVAVLWSRAPDPPSVGQAIVEGGTAVAMVVAGFLIARRRPRNAVGAVLALLGAAATIDLVAAVWAAAASVGDVGGAGWAVALLQGTWVLFFLALAWLALLFPDGRPPSPRWRAPVAVAPVAVVLILAGGLLAPETFDAPYAAVAHPVATLPAPTAGALRLVGLLLLLGTLVLAAAAIAVRARRATGVERLQMKWLAVAAPLVPLAVAAALIEALVTGDVGVVGAVALWLCILALPAAVSVAMLRHGLYDVDRLISRTLAWALLTILLAALFAAVALTVALGVGGRSAVGTGVAALAIAAAFGPLRRRLQRALDRRFDRDAFHAVASVEAFTRELRDGRAEPDGIEEVLRRALGDPGLRLFVWLPDGETHVDMAGASHPALEAGDGRSRTVVRRGEQAVAVVEHDARLDARPRLVADVLRAAALPLEVARLGGEVRRRLAEVRESRIRIVRAGYEERRRLERDLHDGAQQGLVALGMKLRRLQRRLAGADPDAGAALDEAVDELGRTVVELREIARGLRPGALDGGLRPALDELARRTPIAMRVDAPVDLVSDEVQIAAYYVACEAVANAVKHAGANRIVVQAHREDGALRVSVADDGVGGAVSVAGGGLAGLADRVAAHGGSLQLESPPGAGTRVEVVLPCAS
jgi:signal transduction histidine kinase